MKRANLLDVYKRQDQTYTDINLKSGEEYVYGVVAVDKEGVISEEKTVRVTPVSYTHLDVYKRQRHRWTAG